MGIATRLVSLLLCQLTHYCVDGSLGVKYIISSFVSQKFLIVKLLIITCTLFSFPAFRLGTRKLVPHGSLSIRYEKLGRPHEANWV